MYEELFKFFFLYNSLRKNKPILFIFKAKPKKYLIVIRKDGMVDHYSIINCIINYYQLSIYVLKLKSAYIIKFSKFYCLT